MGTVASAAGYSFVKGGVTQQTAEDFEVVGKGLHREEVLHKSCSEK